MSKQQALPEPGRWAREELWRFVYPNDEKQANALRRVLYEMLIYPRYDLATNGNLAQQEATIERPCRRWWPSWTGRSWWPWSRWYGC